MPFLFSKREGGDYFSVIKFIIFFIFHFQVHIYEYTKYETSRVYLIMYHIIYEFEIERTSRTN